MLKKKSTLGLSILLCLTIVLFILNLLTGANKAQIQQKGKPVSFGVGFSNPSVALIDVTGPISAQTQAFALENLRRINKAKNVSGVIIRINSPGGTTGTSEEIYNEILKMRKNGIKVVASIADLGASGGYYIASACDSIVANASSLTGSIGVIISTFNVKGLTDKFGVKAINLTSGKMKDMLSPFRDMRPDELEYIQGMITTIYKQFVNDVFVGRGGKITKEKLLSVADGRVFTGVDAKRLGLIDELGGFSKSVEVMQALLKTSSVSLQLMPRTLMEQIVRNLGIGADSKSTISPESLKMAAMQAFLEQHTNVPLYYSSMGGTF